uniref:Uncharacterized protein n=1 Tax=Leptobrachium leishanense TaxID=445787 RepID=A0A8C5PDE2_9ANUR
QTAFHFSNIQAYCVFFFHSIRVRCRVFPAPIDWTEPWLIGLVAFHVLCFTITCISFKYYKLHIDFCLLLVFILSYSNQQYSDPARMFISLVFSVPVLCNTIIIVGSTLMVSFGVCTYSVFWA